MGMFSIDVEWGTELRSGDPLGFPGYGDRLAARSGESVRTGRNEHAVVIAGDFSVFGGSMGVVHGEKVVRAIDRAIAAGLPVLVRSRSGGARMQEGMVSLIQMARCAQAMGRLRDAGLASVAIMEHPTTGGVFASYASLCDLRGAVAGATIGFAGPRVAEAFTGESVAGRSHTAETALANGLVDFVGTPDEVEAWASAALGFTEWPMTIRPLPEDDGDDASAGSHGAIVGSASGAWGEVLASRRRGRPTGLDVAAALVDSWIELAGVDPTVRSGLAGVGGRAIVVIAQDRYAGTGRTTPAGYTTARRAIELAGRRGLPIVTLVDTPGAEPGSDAENAGIGGAIAETFLALSQVDVPTVSVCVGEGGSGGALALAVTDRLLIQEHAVFSVIGAEGAAAILHRDPARAPEVAAQLRLTSTDLAELGIVDAIVPDDLAATVTAIVAALDAADRTGRHQRFAAASARCLSLPG